MSAVLFSLSFTFTHLRNNDICQLLRKLKYCGYSNDNKILPTKQTHYDIVDKDNYKKNKKKGMYCYVSKCNIQNYDALRVFGTRFRIIILGLIWKDSFLLFWHNPVASVSRHRVFVALPPLIASILAHFNLLRRLNSTVHIMKSRWCKSIWRVPIRLGLYTSI
jgi:hypothetical protein